MQEGCRMPKKNLKSHLNSKTQTQLLSITVFIEQIAGVKYKAFVCSDLRPVEKAVVGTARGHERPLHCHADAVQHNYNKHGVVKVLVGNHVIDPDPYRMIFIKIPKSKSRACDSVKAEWAIIHCSTPQNQIYTDMSQAPLLHSFI
jgi:hypothetical protein